MFFMANEASGLIFGFILMIFSDISFNEPMIALKSLLKISGFVSGNVLTFAIKYGLSETSS